MQLSSEGPGYQVLRLSRQRNHGHPQLIDYLRGFGRRVEAARLGTALIGDMSQPRGGPMSFGHASHQIGLDADIWLRLDLPRLSVRARETLKEVSMVDYTAQGINRAVWSNAQAELIRLAALDPRVSRIFVNPLIKKALCEKSWPDRSWLRLVRPWFYHDAHMHVRLHCPAGSPDCEAQTALPPGDGCDEVDSWLPVAKPVVKPRPANPKPPRIALPAACQRVLRAHDRPPQVTERLP